MQECEPDFQNFRSLSFLLPFGSMITSAENSHGIPRPNSSGPVAIVFFIFLYYIHTYLAHEYTSRQHPIHSQHFHGNSLEPRNAHRIFLQMSYKLSPRTSLPHRQPASCQGFNVGRLLRCAASLAFPFPAKISGIARI